MCTKISQADPQYLMTFIYSYFDFNGRYASSRVETVSICSRREALTIRSEETKRGYILQATLMFFDTK